MKGVAPVSESNAMKTSPRLHARRRFRPLAAAAAALVAPVLGACSHTTETVSKHREARVFHVDHADLERFDVTSQKGRIDIAPHGTELPKWARDEVETLPVERPGEVMIIAVLQSDERERLEDVTLEPRTEDGTLRLKADWPYSFSDDDGDGVEFAIRAPSILHVSGDTGFGDIRIEHAGGLVEIDTGFGDIRLTEQAGPVDAETGFGDVRVAFTGEHTEESDLDSGFGDIRATNVSGPIKANSGFGDVRLQLTDDNAGPVDADSGFGDVRIDAGPAFAGRSLPTSGFGNARVKYQDDDERRETSNVSTGFGDATVTIRSRDD